MTGPLDNFASFPYENFLYQIKRCVPKPSCVLQQVISRFQELQNTKLLHSSISLNSHSFEVSPLLKNQHFSGPIPTLCNFYQQFNKIVSKKFTLTTAKPKNCVMKGSDICLVSNIFKKESEVLVMYKKFMIVRPFFDYPCNSTDFNICKVSNLSAHSVCSFDAIQYKAVLLPLRNDAFVAIPLVHTW